ncbi:hypothetical protein SAMN06265222_1248 [Neorhodopirellula lusitana]|uniref:Uncharacterized protein n=2 Tax=Neorhodopirellula lusitana TaxID=445327 RepID=A0ABY1QQ42_9BACT|nr:hypothetical protein SAMN06265222_1248 [Neorhodopirellula lusitana]
MAGFSKLLRCYRDRKGLLTDLVVEAEQAWIALSFVVPDVVFDQLYRGDDWATIESWMRRVPILYWDWPGSEIREIYDTEKARWIEGSYGDDWQVVFDVIGAVAVVHRTFHEWSHGSASTDHAFLHHDNSLSRLYELEQVLFQVYSETPVDRHTGERTVARRMSPR